MAKQVFRDQHARGMRGPLLPDAVPRHRSRQELFDELVLSAYAPFQRRFGSELETLDLAVDTVPRMRTDSIAPDEVAADGPIALGRTIPAGVDNSGRPTRARLVLFRMPLEQRAYDRKELHQVISAVLTHLVAGYLNMVATDIDPDFEWPF